MEDRGWRRNLKRCLMLFDFVVIVFCFVCFWQGRLLLKLLFSRILFYARDA
jgi:hypothetical protein